MVIGRLELAATLKGSRCFSKVPRATSKLNGSPPVYWIARLCSLNIWPGHALAFPPPPLRGHHQVPILYLFLLSSVSVRHPNLQPESIHHIHSHPYRFIPPSLLVLPLTPAFFALFLSSVTLGLVLLHACASSASASFKRRSFPSLTLWTRLSYVLGHPSCFALSRFHPSFLAPHTHKPA